VSLAALPTHTAAVHAASPGVLPYLLSDSRPVAVAIIVYYATKAAVFLLASVVGIFTKDEKRRKACLDLAQMICWGWSLPRLPGRSP
jgi:hypothetical protein